MKKVTCLVVAVISVFVYGLAMAAGGGSAPVTVVNTSSNPVPVTGTITGTANVNVTNTTAIPISGNVGISNTPNVNIANSPTVNINSSTPLSVQDAANPAFSPFFESAHETFTVDYVNVLLHIGEAQPGKRLVLEHVSVFCDGDEDDSFSAYIRIKSTAAFHVPLVMTNQGQTALGKAHWVTSQSLRLYSDIDSMGPTVEVHHIKVSTTPTCFAHISGYTVNIPQ